MNAGTMPRFARGVRLRRDPDGNPLLLVPEGLLRLNDSAAATLALVDGHRTFDEIVSALCARFGISRDEAARDVAELFDRLHSRGYVDQ
jgi:pyrroloquinoline quinone biosynthesis protein D